MIFVSAGTQLPFDRFIEIIDRIAGDTDEEVVVQAISSAYEPRHFKMLSTIPHDQFVDYLQRSRLVVSHAGMGTILTCMLNSKPIVIFPRRGALGEHRNDHQMATARHFSDMGYVHVAEDEATLRKLISDPGTRSLHTAGPYASAELVDYVKGFIDGKPDKR